MKTILSTLLLASAALTLSGCATSSARNSGTGSGQVRVEFDRPENFTDVKSRYGGGNDPAILNQLRDSLVDEASRSIPPGDTLTVTFTDIDLAGDYEPWHITTEDVRMVKAVYPPRAKFTWKLTEPSGAVVRQGTENLQDNAFLSQANVRNDPYYYDKQLLSDWVRRTFR